MQVLSLVKQVGSGLFSPGLLELSPLLTPLNHLLKVVGQQLLAFQALVQQVVRQELFAQVL